MSFVKIWNEGLLSQFTFESENTLGILLGICVLISIVAGYLLGSINLSIILSSKYYKDDIRRHGSGNAGMTNVMRTYGKKMAVQTSSRLLRRHDRGILLLCRPHLPMLLPL